MVDVFSGLFVAALLLPAAVVVVMMAILAITPRARRVAQFTPEKTRSPRVAA